MAVSEEEIWQFRRRRYGSLGGAGMAVWEEVWPVAPAGFKNWGGGKM